jgi:hypothetical protein
MKQKLNYLFSLFCVLLFFSCTEEKDYIEKSNNGSFKKISFEEFQKNTNAMRTFNVIETKTKMAKSSQRIIFDSINNFSIDTDKIIIAEKDGKICYTILIERPYATSITENLVLKEVENGLYIPFILEYDFNDLDKEKAYNLEFIPDLNSKLTILKPEVLDLDDFVETNNVVGQCTYVYVLYCTCNQHSGDLTGCECIGLNVSQQCDNGGGGGDDSSSSSTSSGGTSGVGQSGGGGGGPGGDSAPPPPPPNNNTANQNQIITLPLVDLEEEEVITKTPCEHLNSLLSNTALQTGLQNLKTLNNGQEEHGFFIKNGLNAGSLITDAIPNDPSDPHHLKLDGANGLSTGKVIAVAHCHTNIHLTGGVQMFSSQDVLALYKISRLHVNNKTVKDYSYYTVFITTMHGNFAVKFKGFEGFTNFNQNFDKFRKKLDRKFKISTENITKIRLLNIFLNSMKESGFNSIGLYEGTEITQAGSTTINGWNELVLDETTKNNPPIEIPCI